LSPDIALGLDGVMTMLRPLAWCLGLGAAAATVLTVGGDGSVVPLAATFVGIAAGGAAGNFGHEVCKALDRRVVGKLLDGRSGIAENHVVAQALRLAQLKALRTVLERFNAAHVNNRDPKRRDDAERFSAELDKFIAEQAKPTAVLAFASGNELSPKDRELRLAVLNSLPEAFDQGLAARRMAGDKMAIAESLHQIRRTVEVAVLTEFPQTLVAAGEELPAPFLALFLGTDRPDGWFDLFVREAADRIKDGEGEGAFEKIWNTEQTAMIKAIIEAHTAVLADIAATTTRTEQAVLAQEAKIDAILATVQAEKGLPLPVLREIIVRFGNIDLTAEPQQIRQYLEAKADELQRLVRELDSVKRHLEHINNSSMGTRGRSEEAGARAADGIAHAESFEETRNRAIGQFVREDYKGEAEIYFHHYLELMSTFGEPHNVPECSGTVSEETRNAMHHLGRASVSADEKELARELELASWHLNLGSMRILIAMIDCLHGVIANIIEYDTAKKAKRVDKSVQSYVANLREDNRSTLDLIRKMTDRSDMLRSAPRLPEIETMRAIVSRQHATLKAYMDLLLELRPDPSIIATMRSRRSWLQKVLARLTDG